jgi:tetratricopeptide (TPR) repeat protein
MRDTHATPEDLAELLAGEPSARVADHLFSCHDCWREACEVLHRVSTDRLSLALRDSLSTREPRRWALLERFRLEETRLEDSLGAQAAIARIRGMKRKQRKEYVAKTRIFHNSACVRALLEEARASNVPYEAEEWADLSIVSCYQVVAGFSESERHDLLAECYSEHAGARRRSARWQSARDAVRQGREHHSKGSGSSLSEGHICMVEGCIEGDLGGLARAEELLERAAESFNQAGAPRLAAKAIIQIAYVVLDVAPERTVCFLRRAEPLIPWSDRRLSMFAESIRVDALITLGCAREAMRRFESLTLIYDQFSDPFVQLRRRFTAGRLLEAVGRVEEATLLFNDVIASDLEQRSNKSFFLDLVYLLDSCAKRGDVSGALAACDRALEAVQVLDLDELAQQQMRELWSGLRRHVTVNSKGFQVIIRARQYIKTQWRTVGGDALLIKESTL